MKIHFVTVGSPNLKFTRDGFTEYVKRIKRFHKISVTHLKEKNINKQILKFMDGKFNIVLDEHGREFESIELANYLDKKTTEGISEIAFYIGGPDGHSNDVINKANLIWSFSKLTFPHDIAMLLLAEAIYRVSTINVNHPYHRE